MVGYVYVDANASAIYLHKEDEEHHLLKNGLWIQLAEGVSASACPDSYVLVEGTCRARSTGHRSWSRCHYRDYPVSEDVLTPSHLWRRP